MSPTHREREPLGSAHSHLSDCQCKQGPELARFDHCLSPGSPVPPVYVVMEATSLSSRPRTLFTPISYLVAGCRRWRLYSVASLAMAALSVLPAGTQPRALMTQLVPVSHGREGECHKPAPGLTLGATGFCACRWTPLCWLDLFSIIGKNWGSGVGGELGEAGGGGGLWRAVLVVAAVMQWCGTGLCPCSPSPAAAFAPPSPKEKEKQKGLQLFGHS